MGSIQPTKMTRELYIAQDGTGQPLVWTHGVEPDWGQPICFLIHGYNVDPQGAAEAYSRLFHSIQRRQVLPALLNSRSWLVYWAGYASGGLATGKSIISPLTYAQQIPSAMAAAQALRRYIDQYSRPESEITVIAHSLGCRLALELLDSYITHPTIHRPVFRAVILMAAAVSYDVLEDLSALWRGALIPEQRSVLFSHDDLVLAGPFRAGQTLAGEGFFPRAVGATGRPLSGFWTRTVRTRNGHSGYFDDDTSADEVSRCLGLAIPSMAGDVNLTGVGLEPPRVLPALELASRFVTGERRRR